MGTLQARILEWVAISSSMNVYFVFSTEDTAVTKTDMVPDPHGAHSLARPEDPSTPLIQSRLKYAVLEIKTRWYHWMKEEEINSL